MRITTILNKLIQLQGVWVRGVDLDPAGRALTLDVVPRTRRHFCGQCGLQAAQVKDRRQRCWRHLDLFGLKTFVRYSICRVRCELCEVTTEAVPWAAHDSRFTRVFEREVAWMAQRIDLSSVAAYFRVTWRSVQRIIASVVVEAWDASQRLEGLRVIGIDEISYRRHHKYLTIVVDHATGRVVWAGEGRRRETLERFFALLGPERASQLQAISTDMWEAYAAVIRRRAPQARVIFDRFHIVRHLNRAVIRVRQQLVESSHGEARRALRHTKFPMLRSPHSRSAEDRRVIEQQVRANRPLYRAMLLKDDFMDLYTYRREGWAKRFLDGWLFRAMRSKLEPIKRIARMLREHKDGVIGWVTWQISNGRLEGMNNRIRLLSHRSFGLHSADALIQLVYLCCGGIKIERVH